MKSDLKIFSCIFILWFFSFTCIGQKNYDTQEIKKDSRVEHSLTNPSLREIFSPIKEKSKSGNAYVFMELRAALGAFNALIEVSESGKANYIVHQRELIDNIIHSSERSASITNNVSYKDEFKGWIVKKPNERNHSTLNTEVPLFESYSFFYIIQFLYLLRENGWVDQSKANSDWWKQTLDFIERNVWTKWYERSLKPKGNNYWYFLRNRTHIGSHWAGFAMYLGALTDKHVIKRQADKLINQYDILLKRNLKRYCGGYIWNSTYDNIEGTYAAKGENNIIQDVSHGNHVVTYIIAAYEFGNKLWTLEDIRRLSYTLKYIIYDKENNLFHDNVDGSTDNLRTGWGNFISDGWIKLAAYDKELKAIFEKFGKTNMLKRYNQETQFKANLYKINFSNE